MDTLLQDLLRQQQVQDLQRKRQQEQAQMAAMQQISAGLTPEQQQLATAFGPDVLRNIVMPTQEAFTLGEGQRRFVGDREVAAVPKPEETSQTYRDYLQAKNQGYPGSFVEYQELLKRAGRTQVTATATTGGARVGTIPPGFELVEDPRTGALSMRPIPGGPAEKEQIAEAEKANHSPLQSTERIFPPISQTNSTPTCSSFFL
jgi:hypothetical protein